MASMQNITSRRAMLGALALAPMAAAVALPTPAAAAVIDRRQWDAAFSKMAVDKRQAEIALADFDAMHARFEQLKPSFETIDWASLPQVKDRLKFAVTQDLDKYWDWYQEAEGIYWQRSEEATAKARTKKGLDSVREFRSRTEAVRRAVRYRQVEDRYDRLLDIECDQSTLLMALPAPDAAALAWKMDQLFGADAVGIGDGVPGYSLAYIRQTLSDVARLTGRPQAD